MRKVPAYGFAFHIRVGREQDVLSSLGFAPYAVQYLSSSPERYVLGLKVIRLVHTKLTFRQIPYMAVRCDHLILATQKFADRLSLGRRLDYNQIICHLYTPSWDQFTSFPLQAKKPAHRLLNYSRKFHRCQG